MTDIIRIDPAAAKLKRAIRRHLRALGFGKDVDGRLVPPDLTKETYRKFHESQRRQKLERNAGFLEEVAPSLIHHFANGSEVNPSNISPALEAVLPGTEEAQIFRLGSLYWSIPVSEGYGRRLRFLVRDTANGKVIGLIGLGDPVFNLRVRDQLIGWNHEQRAKRLVNVLDAFVLGAFPPYSGLLCGKLVACLVRSKEIANAFKRKYGSSRGVISQEKKNARLALVTTTSALGRSSVYNRLRLRDQPYFDPVGFTEGWGHFHFPPLLFDEMRDYLGSLNDSYWKNNRFGQGPNWRLRAIRQALDRLGISSQSIHHGLKREVFICKLADNAFKYLRGENKRLTCSSLLTVAEIATAASERWIRPRALRRPEYQAWSRGDFLLALNASATVKELKNVSSIRPKD